MTAFKIDIEFAVEFLRPNGAGISASVYEGLKDACLSAFSDPIDIARANVILRLANEGKIDFDKVTDCNWQILMQLIDTMTRFTLSYFKVKDYCPRMLEMYDEFVSNGRVTEKQYLDVCAFLKHANTFVSTYSSAGILFDGNENSCVDIYHLYDLSIVKEINPETNEVRWYMSYIPKL